MRYIVHGSFHYEFDTEKKATKVKEVLEKACDVKGAKNKRSSVEMVMKPGGE